MAIDIIGTFKLYKLIISNNNGNRIIIIIFSILLVNINRYKHKYNNIHIIITTMKLKHIIVFCIVLFTTYFYVYIWLANNIDRTIINKRRPTDICRTYNDK